MPPKRLPPVKNREPALEPQRKACRCRGKSTGAFYWDSGEPTTAGIGMLCGLRLLMTCDRCGKKWRRGWPRELTCSTLRRKRYLVGYSLILKTTFNCNSAHELMECWKTQFPERRILWIAMDELTPKERRALKRKENR